ncbi:MAG: hypothetical protein AB7I59_30330 [Geminicoccaceae bacterium]
MRKFAAFLAALLLLAAPMLATGAAAQEYPSRPPPARARLVPRVRRLMSST